MHTFKNLGAVSLAENMTHSSSIEEEEAVLTHHSCLSPILVLIGQNVSRLALCTDSSSQALVLSTNHCVHAMESKRNRRARTYSAKSSACLCTKLQPCYLYLDTISCRVVKQALQSTDFIYQISRDFFH